MHGWMYTILAITPDPVRSMRPLPSLILLTFVWLISFSAAAQPDENPAIQVDLVLEENLRIQSGDGTDESKPLLGSITNVSTGLGGEIYLYDHTIGRIFVYGPDGTYRRAFGRAGKGPGDLGSVFELFVDSRNRLIISDGKNARFSLFHQDGTYLRSEPFHGIRSVYDIDELPDGRFVVTGWHENRSKMIHILDSELSAIETSMLDMEELVQSEDHRILETYRSRTGYLQVLDDGRIAFAPFLYDGWVRIFEQGSQDEWAISRKLRGFRPINEPVRVSSQSGSRRTSILEEIPTGSYLSLSMFDGSFDVVYLLARSEGLYTDGNGSLVHLSDHFTEEGPRVFAERFDPDGDVPVYGRLLEGREAELDIKGFTPEGMLYIASYDSLYLDRLKLSGLD